MNCIQAPGGTRTMLIYLQRGDYVIEELTALFEREGIDAALVVGGIGSLDICKMHTITKTSLPSQDRFLELRGPVEVGSLQGSVAGGEPHIHIVVDDVANDKVYVGHLEAGSRVCYRMELGIVVLEGAKTQRKVDPGTGLVNVVQVES